MPRKGEGAKRKKGRVKTGQKSKRNPEKVRVFLPAETLESLERKNTQESKETATRKTARKSPPPPPKKARVGGSRNFPCQLIPPKFRG